MVVNDEAKKTDRGASLGTTDNPAPSGKTYCNKGLVILTHTIDALNYS